MDIEAINFTLMLYSLICILFGALFTWISMKKNSSSKSIEIENLNESLNDILQKKPNGEYQLNTRLLNYHAALQGEFS